MEWMKPRNVLKMLGYAAITTGVAFGVVVGVLHLVSLIADISFDVLIGRMNLPTMRMVLYTLVAGGICLADLKILEKLEERQMDEWKYAVMIAQTFISVVSLVVSYFIFDIGRESGLIKKLSWELAVVFFQIVVKYDSRRQK